ncbi:MAG: response regulator transcription factor [Cohnella sp.]|nr:response regulator transcription factor [Cohnella sp.]
MLVEDDASIAELVGGYLTKEGFLVTTAADGEEGLSLAASESFDFIVADLMMPGMDGLEMIRRVRESSSVPILIMSAKDGEVDKALGLGFGADDYITKPFSMLELAARIKAGIRRATKYAGREEQQASRLLTFDRLTIDLDNFSAVKDGTTVKLTSKEFEILKLLATNPNRVFTKAQIYGLVWQDDYLGDDNVINVHMRRLREKIEDNPSDPQLIKTLWAIGYKWEGK